MRKSDYLDPRWQKFRLERLTAANWTCETCGDDENTLHIHHPYYVPGRKIWEYPLLVTMVLCDVCHETVHEIISNTGPDQWEYDLEASLEQKRMHFA